MAKRLAALVRQEGLAHVARSIDLGRHLILSRGEAEGGGRDNAATLADACEAVIGAIYLDAGLDAARQFVRAPLGRADRRRCDAAAGCQDGAAGMGAGRRPAAADLSGGGIERPAARSRSSPSRSRVSGKRTAQASGKSKRAAEQAAAASLMAELRS